jgi:hypothetical protein
MTPARLVLEEDPLLGFVSLLSGVVSGKSITTCIHYRLLVDTLPLFVDIQHPLDLWLHPNYIGIGMAVNPKWSDHIKSRSDHTKNDLIKWSLI